MKSKTKPPSVRAKARQTFGIPKIHKYHRGQIADAILSAYKDVQGYYRLLPQPPRFTPNVVLSNTPHSLGDCVVLTALPWEASKQGQTRYSWSPRRDSVHIYSTFVPEWRLPEDRTWLTDGQHFIYHFNCGNGHLLQKWNRAFGLKTQLRPQGRLVVPQSAKYLDRVILHFEPSVDHTKRQRDEFRFHPQPRQLYDTSKFVIEQFIKNHPNLEFVEVGHKPRGIRGVNYIETKTTDELIRLIATGSWFIGVLSGPLHIATALNLNVITIINFPRAHQIVLPVIRSSGVPEEEWLYPQNVVLHQDSGTLLVPQFSLTSLEAAFNGEVYPFFEEHWLDLVFEEKYIL